MKPTATLDHEVVSRSQWLHAHGDVLAKEKELTRLSDELSRQRRGQRHGLANVAGGAIAIVERHLAGATLQQAGIADGDTVGIVAQIVEQLLRSGKGGLGVDDPGPMSEGREQFVKARGVGQRRHGLDRGWEW
jgi:hypothetical protein